MNKRSMLFALLAIFGLFLAGANNAYAIPDCICYGNVWFGSTQLTTYTVEAYSSPVNQTTNYDSTYYWSPNFYFGSHDWAAGTYYFCIRSGSYWYHTSFYHTVGTGENLGSVYLSSNTHPMHRDQQ